jgi:predicted HAD superfamily Cof-like phosphohydrolase
MENFNKEKFYNTNELNYINNLLQNCETAEDAIIIYKSEIAKIAKCRACVDKNQYKQIYPLNIKMQKSELVSNDESENTFNVYDETMLMSKLLNLRISTPSDALLVKQFTEESTGKLCPTSPQKMSTEKVRFIIKMVFSEMAELAQTVRPLDTMFWLYKIFEDIDIHHDYIPKTSDIEIIAEQGDAMVDAWYYMLNAAAKDGINLSSIFNLVHAANMNKRHADGQFHRRADGKVEKPPNWQEPNINAEIRRQIDDGSW